MERTAVILFFVDVFWVHIEIGVEYRLRTKVPNDEDINSALYVYFQSGLLDPSEYSRMALLAQIMKEPTFTQLRVRSYLIICSTCRLCLMSSLCCCMRV